MLLPRPLPPVPAETARVARRGPARPDDRWQARREAGFARDDCPLDRARERAAGSDPRARTAGCRSTVRSPRRALCRRPRAQFAARRVLRRPRRHRGHPRGGSAAAACAGRATAGRRRSTAAIASPRPAAASSGAARGMPGQPRCRRRRSPCARPLAAPVAARAGGSCHNLRRRSQFRVNFATTPLQ